VREFLGSVASSFRMRPDPLSRGGGKCRGFG
jgi:hypothetical protein